MTPSPVRSIVLWCPDWPVLAWLQGRRDDSPLAVVKQNTVVACSPAARSEDVRVGMRRRDAQAICPALKIVNADDDRDQKAFAPVLARIEQISPGVQVIQPGLCVLRAQGPARYYGGESAAARRIIAHVGELGITDPRAGIADGVFAAEQAARWGTSVTEPVRVIPVGGAAEFLAPMPVATIADAQVSGLLNRLGVRTLGDFAAMSEERVRERLGQNGTRLRTLAAGLDPRGVEPRIPPPQLHREIAFDPPLELADQIAFAMRRVAEDFITGLSAHDLVCTELHVELTGDRGEHSERVWLHPTRFDAADIVDRVRWQLAEGATQENTLNSGVVSVRIAPVAVDDAFHHAPVLFGAGAEERVHHALSRVQGMLGHRGVLTTTIGGGRWLSERQVLIPWGDRPEKDRAREHPWPGRLPGSVPGSVFPSPLPIDVRAADGETVTVDGRGLLSASISGFTHPNGAYLEARAWAGPWPLSERGWDPERARRAYRFQVLDSEETAWLLTYENGTWTAEGRYD